MKNNRLKHKEIFIQSQKMCRQIQKAKDNVAPMEKYNISPLKPLIFLEQNNYNQHSTLIYAHFFKLI